MDKENRDKIKIALNTAEAQINILKLDIQNAERAGLKNAVKIGKDAVEKAEAKLLKMKLVYGK